MNMRRGQWEWWARAVRVAGAVVASVQVGEARWWLLPDTAALRVAPLSYMFSLPDNKTFYCVTFAEDTEPEVIPAPCSALNGPPKPCRGDVVWSSLC